MPKRVNKKSKKPLIKVSKVSEVSGSDLNDLCDAAEAAIEEGGGFGWLKPPPRQTRPQQGRLRRCLALYPQSQQLACIAPWKRALQALVLPLNISRSSFLLGK